MPVAYVRQMAPTLDLCPRGYTCRSNPTGTGFMLLKSTGADNIVFIYLDLGSGSTQNRSLDLLARPSCRFALLQLIEFDGLKLGHWSHFNSHHDALW